MVTGVQTCALPISRETAGGPVEVDATVFQGHVLWGFTRRVLREFFLGPQPGGVDAAPTREDRHEPRSVGR